MRSVPLIRCLPKTLSSSSTSTGSQIATWRRSLTWTHREFSFDLPSLLTGKIFVWLPAFSLNPVQCDILPHRQSQLSDLTIRLHITTSLKSISQKRWLYHQILGRYGAFSVSAVYLQQFPSYSNHSCKKSSFLRTQAFIFCLLWGRPCGNHAKCCMNEKTIQCLSNPSLHVPIYLQQFPSYSNRKCKKSPFSRCCTIEFKCDARTRLCVNKRTEVFAYLLRGL